MAFSPSIGDILMLSQTAWKIGRAFTAGRRGAPAEFTEIETEANGLSTALKLVAETLHSDDSILSRGSDQMKAGVGMILESAQRSLEDLESFVDQYGVIRKRQTNGGFVVERTWSDVVLANYKTIKWTTEGGDIQALRNMLQMHTNTINLTMQALQSGSLARLEKTVMPMAEKIESIHDRVNGDLGDKIDDLHRIIMTLANSTPSLSAIDAHRRLGSNVSSIEASPSSNGQQLIEEPPPRSSSYSLPVRMNGRRESEQSTRSGIMVASPQSGKGPQDSAYYSMHGTLPFERESRTADLGFDSPEMSLTEAARRESTTLPKFFTQESQEPDTQPGSSDTRGLYRYSAASSVGSESGVPVRPFLPPPAMSPDRAERAIPVATPSSIMSPSQTNHQRNTSVRTTKSSKTVPPSPTLSQAESQRKEFEKGLFRNAATLCDVRGSGVEYTQPIPDEPDPRYNTAVVDATTKCRICVVRKRVNREHGGTRVATSIWSIGDDWVARLQQELPEEFDTVPFCSYFQSEKVSIDIKESLLRFHAAVWAAPTLNELKTNWVNYIFETVDEANRFQSALFGRSLLASFKTAKTTVIHDGFKGTFAFEEQMAGIEVLRVWEDDGVSMPGAAGGVMALLHLSANFGEGWAKWWLNSTRQQVRIKDESGKFARIKGLDVTVVKPGAGVNMADRIRSPATHGEGLLRPDAEAQRRQKWEKKVTGVRVEFASEDEKRAFVALAKRAQERMIPLPEVR